METFRSIRGMADILPDETPLWQSLESIAAELLSTYGYGEIRLPIIEVTELFARSIGEVTDIVEKEMYSFEDRNGEVITLRPEGTAGCVRAIIQHSLSRTPQKVWYSGSMFRYERPQKGRKRQFHQIGAEAFGIGTPDQDVELIAICQELWRRLGVSDAVKLEINSIGDARDRARFREALVGFLKIRRKDLDTDSQRRLETNPIRILDSKHPKTQLLLDDAPQLYDYLSDEARNNFEEIQDYLDLLKIPYQVNPRLVRGLDYYNKLVFEWTTDRLGTQDTLCGGGRYDGLVSTFGGKQTPAAGFAIGIDRLILLMQEFRIEASDTIDCYVITENEAAYRYSLTRIAAIRQLLPELAIVQHLGGGSFKSQFKRADKSGAIWALIYGEKEIQTGQVTVKPLREAGGQETLAESELLEFLSQFLVDIEDGRRRGVSRGGPHSG